VCTINYYGLVMMNKLLNHNKLTVCHVCALEDMKVSPFHFQRVVSAAFLGSLWSQPQSQALTRGDMIPLTLCTCFGMVEIKLFVG